MLKQIFFLFFAAFLVSCTTTSDKTHKLDSVDDIGVVSVFDDTLPIKYLTPKATTTKEHAADVTTWSINNTITTELLSSFKGMNKRAFALEVDPALVQQGKNEARALKDLYLGNRYQGLEQYFLSQAEKQGAQYLFVIHPMGDENFAAYRAGYGMLCQTEVAKGDLEAYFLMRAVLWNVKTREVETRTTLTPADLAFRTGRTCREALRLSPDKLASLYKDQVLDLAKKSADLSIVRTGLSKTR